MPVEAHASEDAQKEERTLSARLPADEYDRYSEVAWSQRTTKSELVRVAMRRCYADADRAPGA